MNAQEWVAWMCSRPDRKNRQRRLFDTLDFIIPNWEIVNVIKLTK
jgi:hypothetical protein